MATAKLPSRVGLFSAALSLSIVVTHNQVIQLSSRLGYSLSRQCQVDPGLVLTLHLNITLSFLLQSSLRFGISGIKAVNTTVASPIAWETLSSNKQYHLQKFFPEGRPTSLPLPGKTFYLGLIADDFSAAVFKHGRWVGGPIGNTKIMLRVFQHVSHQHILVAGQKNKGKKTSMQTDLTMLRILRFVTFVRLFTKLSVENSQPPPYVQCRKPHNEDLLFGIRLRFAAILSKNGDLLLRISVQETLDMIPGMWHAVIIILETF
ncbi:hypothetical protein B0H13DRAFT_1915493 [Mycena leptocephala]|nr:hypothetical protein B0H13DRAFT_1915493 [Mycena leptocephala]